jgi:hypothetical protein
MRYLYKFTTLIANFLLLFSAVSSPIIKLSIPHKANSSQHSRPRLGGSGKRRRRLERGGAKLNTSVPKNRPESGPPLPNS